MKVLSIGNSFSQDAQRYLSRIAAAHGIQMKNVNLYIGGCTLRTHYLNMLDDLRAYEFQYCGEGCGIKVSIREALISDEWDYVTLQQASHKSYDYSTYTPYIEALKEYVKRYCPHAKILIHNTWAYADASERLMSRGYESGEAMLADVVSAYAQAAKAIDADGIIPSGQALMAALRLGMPSVHRDNFHASFGFGRYLLGLVWLKKLTGVDISNDTFDALDEPITDEERRIAIAAANSVF